MDNNFIVELIARLDASKTPTDLNKIEQELNKKGINLKTSLDTATTKQELHNLAKQLQPILKSIGIDIDTSKITSAFNQITRQMQNAGKVADSLRVNDTVTKLNEQLRKNSAYSSEAKNKIKSWIDELSTRGEIPEHRLKQINSEARQLHATMGKLNKTGFSWSDKFKQAWEKFGGWTLVTGAMTRMFQEVKKGVQFIGELDDALTDVAYTSNTSKSQLIDLGDSAIDMAKDLNASAKNVLEAVKIYSTAKSTADDILRKSKPALMLSNVSGMSGSESSKTINTALNQFELEDTEENLVDIVDTYEYVASQLNYDFTDAIKELTEGIEASGSVAKNAGLDMQEYATMVGIAVEKTGQSGSTIGQAYKTLFSRITKASATEGTLDEDISAAEKSLRSVGVEVRDSADEFRDLTDIMADLGKVWNSLSSVEKSNIGFNIAGTRQLNVLNSLLGAWDDYSAIIGTIDERTGEALENQEEYADSLKGHLGDLSATGQSIWKNIFDSDDFKDILSDFNKLLSILDKITETVGTDSVLTNAIGLFTVNKLGLD